MDFKKEKRNNEQKNYQLEYACANIVREEEEKEGKKQQTGNK